MEAQPRKTLTVTLICSQWAATITNMVKISIDSMAVGVVSWRGNPRGSPTNMTRLHGHELKSLVEHSLIKRRQLSMMAEMGLRVKTMTSK